MTYAEWIAAYVAKHDGFVRGKCKKATEEMIATFPELRKAAGFVYCRWGRDQHWWCVDPDGTIVDPTAAQFQGYIYGYKELDFADPEDVDSIPIGKCANCGGPIYRTSERTDTVCSNICANEGIRLNPRI